jgi:hypothetical protein
VDSEGAVRCVKTTPAPARRMFRFKIGTSFAVLVGHHSDTRLLRNRAMILSIMYVYAPGTMCKSARHDGIYFMLRGSIWLVYNDVSSA